MKQCLLVIDMQNAVFSLKRPVYRKEILIENVQQAVAIAGERGMQVVYSLHENDTFLKKGTFGHRLTGPLAVREGDLLIHKSKPDVFGDSYLEETLRRLHIASLTIAGVISNGCVRTACLSALAKGFAVTLLSDAHSTFFANPEKHIAGVNSAVERAGARVIPVDAM